MTAHHKHGSPKDFLAKVLAGKEYMLMDGATGTLIQQAGLADVHEVPDLLNLTHAQDVVGLQRLYVDAGSDCIVTSTFNSNPLKLDGTGVGVQEVFAAAARNARATGARLVAADIGPTGALLAPMGKMTFDEAYAVFTEQARAAKAAGCDLIALETFSDLLEAKIALLACLDETDLPVVATMTFGEDGRTFMGTTPAIAATTLSSIGAAAVGINCSLGPEEIAPLVTQMAPYARCPIMVQPNAGLPRIDANGNTVFDIEAQGFAEAMAAIMSAGATIVGGCCGTTPEHIAALRAVVDDCNLLPIEAREHEPSFIVASAQEMVEFEPDARNIAVIGERINPTGRKSFQKALADGHLDKVVAEAVAQMDAGADLLDVNVGVPGIDEAGTLASACELLQSTVTAPLQIDSSSPEALDAACRIYAGRPLINSVNGKKSSLEAILPIARRYGATLVCLTLDEDGIPSSADARIRIAKRIIAAAEEAGIPKEDLAVDCLVMSAATNQAEALQILEAVRRCKEELGVRTVLGVSNISFGLPLRPVMNAAFLVSALASGLDMPIINPLEPRYQDAVHAFRVLNGQDAGCMRYIDYCADAPEPAAASPAGAAAAEGPSHCGAGAPQPSTPSEALYACVLEGRRDAAADATRALLPCMDVASIAGDVLGPALDEVGVRYDQKRYYLPQLMASAEAAKASFDVLSEQSSTGQRPGETRNELPIVIATVEGDVHDIGKNIVRMLLENHGFNVIDLGKDVPPAKIVEAAVENGSKLVGLSALMTTTLPAMEETISLLKAQGSGIEVMVGGAVLTEEYAEKIGADFYAKDAQASVRLAQEVFKSGASSS